MAALNVLVALAAFVLASLIIWLFRVVLPGIGAEIENVIDKNEITDAKLKKIQNRGDIYLLIYSVVGSLTIMGFIGYFFMKL